MRGACTQFDMLLIIKKYLDSDPILFDYLPIGAWLKTPDARLDQLEMVAWNDRPDGRNMRIINVELARDWFYLLRTTDGGLLTADGDHLLTEGEWKPWGNNLTGSDEQVVAKLLSEHGPYFFRSTHDESENYRESRYDRLERRKLDCEVVSIEDVTEEMAQYNIESIYKSSIERNIDGIYIPFWHRNFNKFGVNIKASTDLCEYKSDDNRDWEDHHTYSVSFLLKIIVSDDPEDDAELNFKKNVTVHYRNDSRFNYHQSTVDGDSLYEIVNFVKMAVFGELGGDSQDSGIDVEIISQIVSALEDAGESLIAALNRAHRLWEI